MNLKKGKFAHIINHQIDMYNVELFEDGTASNLVKKEVIK